MFTSILLRLIAFILIGLLEYLNCYTVIAGITILVLCSRFCSVLIVDWDVHHGQASQLMFWNDPKYGLVSLIWTSNRILSTTLLFS